LLPRRLPLPALCLALLLPGSAQGQLGWPLDQPAGARRLSSSFAESRGSHLHGGVDLSTAGQVGVPVLAAADGEIYRVKVKWRGLGRAVYVRHAGGLITVSGHLAGLAGPLGAWVDERVAKKGPYPGDLWPDPPIPVRRGQVIAWSGKTGGGPPHLHFETRRDNGNRPVDPSSAGLPCPDKLPPRLLGLRYHAEGASSAIDLGEKPALLPLHRKGRLSVLVEDPMGAGTGGLRSLRALAGDVLLAEFDATSFRYGDTGRSGFWYERGATSSGTSAYWLHALPGGLPFQHGAEWLPLRQKGEGPLTVRVEATDGCGNSSVLHQVLLPGGAETTATGVFIDAERGGQVEGGGARVDIPSGALAERWAVSLEEAPDVKAKLTLLAGPVRLQPASLPLRKKAKLSFKAPDDRKGAGIFWQHPEGGPWLWWGSVAGLAGRITTTTDRFGTFALLRDDQPPRILSVERNQRPDRPWRAGGAELVVRYDEEGLGLAWDGVVMTWPGGAKQVGEHDPDLSEVRFPLSATSAFAEIRGKLQLVDRAGLSAERELSIPAVRSSGD
jgi:hypothetical protein